MFTWQILEVFSDGKKVTKVRYLLKTQDKTNTVETEGYHQFSDGLIKKSVLETKEADLVGWLESDTIKDGVNAIKLNLENQLKALKNSQKIDFPWLSDTFTME